MHSDIFIWNSYLPSKKLFYIVRLQQHHFLFLKTNTLLEAHSFNLICRVFDYTVIRSWSGFDFTSKRVGGLMLLYYICAASAHVFRMKAIDLNIKNKTPITIKLHLYLINESIVRSFEIRIMKHFNCLQIILLGVHNFFGMWRVLCGRFCAFLDLFL